MPTEPDQHHLAARVRKVELERQALERVLEIVAEAPEVDSRTVMRALSTAAGDPSRLRGLPAIGRNVRGAMRSTQPGEGL